VQQGLPLESEFERTIRTLYQAPLTPLDFHAHAEQARQEINSWTAQHTNGRIPELFAPGSIDAATRLVLTSAIYFYGKVGACPSIPQHARGALPAWRRPHGGRQVHAPEGRFPLWRNALCPDSGDEIPGHALGVRHLLPKATNDGLAGVGAVHQCRYAFRMASGALASRKVEAAIPKFRAESAFSLRDMLSRMGMADAFARTADFSGIDGRRDLFVGDVVHKAFVDVSEEGTEAAAATGVNGSLPGHAARRTDRLSRGPSLRVLHPRYHQRRDSVRRPAPAAENPLGLTPGVEAQQLGLNSPRAALEYSRLRRQPQSTISRRPPKSLDRLPGPHITGSKTRNNLSQEQRCPRANRDADNSQSKAPTKDQSQNVPFHRAKRYAYSNLVARAAPSSMK
jgi:hypothetical protein